MKNILMLLAVGMLSLMLVGCSGSDKNTIVMATNAEFKPYEFIDANGKITGIDVEIMEAICKKLGKELKIENIAFDSIIPAVVSGKADIGVAGMTVTEDRKRSVDFSESYVTAYQVIIVKKDSPIKGLADFAGKRVGVQLGTTGDTLVTAQKGAVVERYSKGAEAVESAIQGKVDAVVIDNEPAKNFVARNADKLVILPARLSEESYAMALKKGNTELLNQINTAIAELKADGTLAAILAKYCQE